jgi:PAS domain S-box-containing protein
MPKAYQLLRALLDAVPDAMMAVDADGRIALANARAEAMFGYDREDLTGEELRLILRDGGRRRRAGTHTPGGGSVARPRPVGMPLRGRRKDGSEFSADVSVSALDASMGGVVAVAVRGPDRDAEATAGAASRNGDTRPSLAAPGLLAATVLEADENAGRLADSFVHDLNNLMGLILNYTVFISEQVTSAAAQPDGDRWEPVRQDVEQVQHAASHAIEITHRLFEEVGVLTMAQKSLDASIL